MDKTVENFNVRLRTVRIRELIVGLVLAIILTIAAAIIFPVIETNDNYFTITLILFIILFFIWCLRGTTGLKENYENIFINENKNEIIYVFIINMAFAFISLFLVSMIDIYLGMSDPTWVTGLDIDSVDITSENYLFEMITSIIFAPVLEELIFRGVLFNRLKIRRGIVPAMIISSLLFAIGHDFGGMTSAFLFGICMCILYFKTDNILIPISVHFLNNILATVFEIINIDSFLSQIPYIYIVGLIAAISTILIIKYIADETSNIKKIVN